jgi:hypothetical protein
MCQFLIERLLQRTSVVTELQVEMLIGRNANMKRTHSELDMLFPSESTIIVFR